jgi:phytanoyl-CoA hydroxylase
MGKIDQQHFTLGTDITADQQDYFNRNGFIRFRNFLSKEQVELCKNEMKRVEKKWIDEGTEKVNGVPIKFGKDENGNTIVQRFCFLSQYSDFLHELIQSAQVQLLMRLLEPYSGRIAEDEKDGLVLNNYLRVAGSRFTHMGWHTDSPRDLFMGQRILPMLNVGIHLDNCPFENGGLRMIPGTHKQGLFKLLLGKKYYVDKDPDPAEVGFDISEGDLTVHDGRIWHRVEQSPFTGAKSQRRVMYVPIITGKYKPKTKDSKTPFYHRFTKKSHY